MPDHAAISTPVSERPPRWECRPARAPSGRRALQHAMSSRASAPASICRRLPAPPPRPTSSEGDDRARGALLDALVDSGIDLGHQLLKIGLRRDHLLIHRISLHALQRRIVLLHLFLRRFLALLSVPFDVLREPFS